MFNNNLGFAHWLNPDVSLRAAERMDRSRELKARAERYRRLAETLFDANIIAVVLACARELEQSAEAIMPDGVDDQTGL